MTAFFIDNYFTATPNGQLSLFAPAYDQAGVWVENQWGTAWGLNGWAELSWNYVSSHVTEVATINQSDIYTGLQNPSVPLPTQTVTPGGGGGAEALSINVAPSALCDTTGGNITVNVTDTNNPNNHNAFTASTSDSFGAFSATGTINSVPAVIHVTAGHSDYTALDVDVRDTVTGLQKNQLGAVTIACVPTPTPGTISISPTHGCLDTPITVNTSQLPSGYATGALISTGQYVLGNGSSTTSLIPVSSTFPTTFHLNTDTYIDNTGKLVTIPNGLTYATAPPGSSISVLFNLSQGGVEQFNPVLPFSIDTTCTIPTVPSSTPKPTPTSTPKPPLTPTPTPSPLSTTLTYPIKVGWNAVSFPFTGPAIISGVSNTSVNALGIINANVAINKSKYTVLDGYTNGQWTPDIFDDITDGLGVNGNNFALQAGKGYIMQSDVAGTIQITGSIPSSATTVTLQTGWNIIGIPKVQAGSTASDVLYNLYKSGFSLTDLEIDNIVVGSGQWQPYTLSQGTTNDFAIKNTESYGLFITKGGSWTENVTVIPAATKYVLH